MSKAKSIGTRFETALVRWLNKRLDEDRIERRALHGSKDMGDIYGLYCHGNAEGIIEAKARRTVTPALLAEWQRQTENEQANAGADFALLAIKVPNKSIDQTRVQMTLASLLAIAGVTYIPASHHGALSAWVEADLETVCKLIGGEYDTED